MKLVGLHPSSALIASPDTPLYEALDRMAHRNVGSIVIVDGNEHDEIRGILTERDVLRRFREMADPDKEFLPVWRFMTSKVISLPLSRMHEAASVMLENRIRHVVITHDEAGAKSKLAGVISMRDLFHMFRQILAPKFEPFTEVGRRIVLVSQVESSRRLFRGMVTASESAMFRIISADDPTLGEALASAESLFIDLDQMHVATWTGIFKTILARPKHPKPIVVLYNPLSMDRNTHDVLCRASEKGVYRILEKPISIPDVYAMLRE